MMDMAMAVHEEAVALTPGRDLLHHANRLGITLHSAGLLQRRYPHSATRRPRTYVHVQRPLTPQSTVHSMSTRSPRCLHYSSPAATYIHDVVVPLATYSGGKKGQQRSTMRSTQHGRGSNIQTVLASLYDDEMVTLPGLNNSGHTLMMSSMPTELQHPQQQQQQQQQHQVRSSVPGPKEKRWNCSGQALRYVREETRTLKRTSEIQPHRIDRMYYMSGSHLNLQHKYHVDSEQLQQLKALSCARQNTKHYGRGLSSSSQKKDDPYTPHAWEETEPPRKPPNSATGERTAAAAAQSEGQSHQPETAGCVSDREETAPDEQTGAEQQNVEQQNAEQQNVEQQNAEQQNAEHKAGNDEQIPEQTGNTEQDVNGENVLHVEQNADEQTGTEQQQETPENDDEQNIPEQTVGGENALKQNAQNDIEEQST